MMQSPTSQQMPAEPVPARADTTETAAWLVEVEEFLEQASRLCVEHGVDPDAFMHAAWTACLDSRPGLREQIADRQLTAEVEAMRKRGVVGQA